MSGTTTYTAEIDMPEELQEALDSRVEEFESLATYIEHLIIQDLKPMEGLVRTHIENILSDGIVEMMRKFAPIVSSFMVDDILLNCSLKQDGASRMIVDIPDFETIEGPYMDRYNRFMESLKKEI